MQRCSGWVQHGWWVLSAAAWGGCCHVASRCCRDVELGSSAVSLGRQHQRSCPLRGSPMAPEATLSWGFCWGLRFPAALPRNAAGTVQAAGARCRGRVLGWKPGSCRSPGLGCQGQAASGHPGQARWWAGSGVRLGPSWVLRPQSGARTSSDGRCPRRRAPSPWGCSQPAW